MSNVTLYHIPPMRSTKCAIIVHEAGLQDKVAIKQLTPADLKGPEVTGKSHLARMPTMVVGDQTVIESAAVALTLHKKFPEEMGKLEPMAGCLACWARFYQVLAYSVDAESVLQRAFIELVFKKPNGDMAVVAAAKKDWEDKVSKQLELWLEENKTCGCGDSCSCKGGQGIYVACSHFTSADAFLFYIVNWANMMGWLEGHPILQAYMDAHKTRASVGKAMEGANLP